MAHLATRSSKDKVGHDEKLPSSRVALLLIDAVNPMSSRWRSIRGPPEMPRMRRPPRAGATSLRRDPDQASGVVQL
jgi:hypothetical protein